MSLLFFMGFAQLLLPITIIAIAFFVYRSRTDAAAAGPGKSIPPNPNDFADWLSPMLVKELRQGMRARAFVGSFLLLQAGMILNVVIGLVASANHQDTSSTTGLFWSITGLLLLIVMPMNGLACVANEIKGNTLDLIFLTQLSARRIIAGKWLAIVAQSALLACAVLPYAVLRYFLGGVNLAADLTRLALMLAASALLSSLMVGSSPHQSKFTRPVFIGLFAIVLPYGSLIMFASGMSGPVVSGGSPIGWRAGFTVASMALLFLVLMLEMGAARIAPLAENHSALKRLIGILFLAGAASVGAGPFRAVVFVIALVVGFATCVGALCEEPTMIPSLYRPFVRRGTAGRLAGRLFYPGWPSGVLYTMLLLGGFYAVLRLDYPLAQERPVALFVAACGAVVMPFALVRFFLPRWRKVAAIFWSVQALSIVLFIVANVADQSLHFGMKMIISFLPGCSFLVALTEFEYDGGYSLALFTKVHLVILALSLIALLIRSVPYFRQISVLERTALVPLPAAAGAAA